MVTNGGYDRPSAAHELMVSLTGILAAMKREGSAMKGEKSKSRTETFVSIRLCLICFNIVMYLAGI